MSAREHWNEVYRTRAAERVSWYRPRLDLSLDFISRTGISPSAAIVDVGGGASTLVDELLQLGYTNVRVLDVSVIALQVAKDRLGDRARNVAWLEGDVTAMDLGESSIDLWHDRAVFHFLTLQADRKAYAHSVSRSVKPGGFLLIATFAPDGPETCSGLPVVRYSSGDLAGQFPDFRLLESASELHTTPSGGVQSFTYVLMERKSG